MSLTSLFFYTLPLAIFGCLIPLTVIAQISADGTTSTTVNQNGNNFTIEQGDRIGDNLFHSFKEFSVPTLGSAAFNNANDIANIFSRVTGSNISSIDGLLSANGGANLFLINPNGIIFGENAKLNLGGSFFASTADSLLFEGNTEFSASNPQAAPLLEVNIPIGINFRDNPGDIVNQATGDGLEVAPGKNLTLVGGNINFEAGNATASSGNIELGGLLESGTVGINDDGRLNFPENVAKADISISDFSGITSKTFDESKAGDIAINADSVKITDSFLITETFDEGKAGDIAINADLVKITDSLITVEASGTGNAGSVNIDVANGGAFNISNSLLAADTIGEGKVGDLSIRAGSVEITDSFLITETSGTGDTGSIIIDVTNGGVFKLSKNSLITADTIGKGNGGDLTITAGLVEITDSLITTETSGTGNAGSVNIDVTNGGAFNLSKNSFISTDTIGEGNAGDLTITAGLVEITDSSSIITLTFGEGNAGDLYISSDSVEITDSSSINAETSGAGDAGNVTIKTGSLNLTSGGQVNASTYRQGNAGDVTIKTGSLTLTKGGEVNANTFGQGNAGLVEITASDTIIIDGEDALGFSSGVLSAVQAGAEGNAGGVNIDTGSLSLTNGGQISTSTKDQGNAGSVEITASDAITIDGENSAGFLSGASSQVFSEAVGNAGHIIIETGSLTLTKGGQISASTFSQGDAGKVTINALETILVDSESSASVSSGVTSRVFSRAVGDAGDVTIDTGSLTLTNGGQVNSSTEGRGNAGNLAINADSVEITDSSEITAETSGTGDAGDVTIETGSLTLTNGGQVNASTEGRGNAGSVEITASDTITIDGEDSNGFASGASSQVFSEAVGNARGVNIETGSLNLTNGGQVNASTEGQGNAGNLAINADSVEITDSSEITVETSGTGDAGDVTIDTGSLTLTNGGQVNASTEGQGNAGSVEITASDAITIDGGAASSQVATEAVGDAGGVTITTGYLTLTNGGQVNASTFGEGNAGNLTINATESISISGITKNKRHSRLSANALESSGKGGKITVDTNQLTIDNGGTIEAGNFDSSGVLNPGREELDSSDSSSFFTPGTGEPGEIKIIANSLSLSNRASINAATQSENGESSENVKSYEITLKIADDIFLRNSSLISARAFKNAEGGKIKIDTEDLILRNNSKISADASKNAKGGNIEIDTEDLILRNNGKISASAFQNAKGGNIGIDTEDLILRNNSKISASAFQNAKGGNIEIYADLIIAFPSQPPENGNDIIANAEPGGDRGNINITALSLFGIQERPAISENGTNDIDASSTFKLKMPLNVDPTSGLIELPEAVGDVTDQISQNICEQGVGSEFIITGKGGLPPNPNEILNSDEEQVGLVEPVPLQRETVGANGIRPESLRLERPTSELELVPAQGWIFNDKGEVTLTSYRTPNTEIGTPNTEIKPSPQQQFNSCPAP